MQWIVVVAGIASFVITNRGQAQSLESVLMPGPVVAGHAEYEDDCGLCHRAFSRELQRELCVDCHTEIAADLEGDMGFHGLTATISELDCSACHTEHEGREADIVGLNRETFDHGSTDFQLLDSHLSVECDSCHLTDNLFRDTSSSCVDCHLEEDVHRANLGAVCSDCHTETRWSVARFDHNTTDFSLTGRHADLTCSGCHRNEQYVDTPGLCIDCHRVDDVHLGVNGDTCQDCHASTSWADTSFDHSVETGFALEGGHGGLVCEACHSENRFEQSIVAECDACHRADDIHLGSNGAQCEGCHAPTQWPEVSFDHGVDTAFALAGAHESLVCTACHKGSVETALPDSTCYGCHLNDDAHQAQLGEVCQTCHSETEWTDSVRFDHDLTLFPLLGLHAAVSCEGCHASPAFHDAEDQCVDCHIEDDVHGRRLGQACESCHNPNDWLIWQFDHNTETDFVLDGGHVGLECEGCHERPVVDAIEMSTSCGSCHSSDDIHVGNFGTDCGQCHTTTSFLDVRAL